MSPAKFSSICVISENITTKFVFTLVTALFAFNTVPFTLLTVELAFVSSAVI